MRSGDAAIIQAARDADRTETRIARGLDDGARLGLGLDAVHGLLHVRIEVLHAQADAVETLAPQAVHAADGHGARIDLDRILAHGIRRKVEAAAQVRHQVFHLRIRQVGRRAAAEVQLLDVVHAGEQAALHLHFALQVGEVGGGLVAVLRDDLVAGAVVADGVAERNVQVQRQRLAGPARAQVGDGVQEVTVAERFREAVGRRIRGITGAVAAQPGDQVGVEFDDGLERVERRGAGDCIEHLETPSCIV